MRLPLTAARGSRAGQRAVSLVSLTTARRVAVAAILLVTLGFSLGLALSGRASDHSTATTQDLGALLERSDAPLVVFSEFAERADTIWAANPDNPGDRVQLAQIEHAYGFGIVPVLSPDGAYIAYTVLPVEASPSGFGAGAELHLLDLASGDARTLATDIELRVEPVWSPESDAVIARRADDAGNSQLVRVGVDGALSPLVTAQAALFPVDFSPDGATLYFTSLSEEGTVLGRVSNGGAPEPVARLSDGFARDWHLSPDGGQVAYLARPEGDSGYAAQVLDISRRMTRAPIAAAAGAQFNPVWEPDGGLTIGRLDRPGAGGTPLRLSAAGGSFEAAGEPLPPPDELDAGFDVPISWSPGGAHLAVRAFEGTSTADPGPSRVVVVTTDGERHRLSARSDVVVAGWLEAAP